MNKQNEYLFIIGILPRCGSNYLYNILLRHRDTVPPAQTGEDNIIYTSDGIFESAGMIKQRWHPSWCNMNKDLFYHRYVQAIGKGILEYYLCPENVTNKMIITKTPFSNNIDKFRMLFPDTKLILLIRNGKDLVESGVRSFRWDYEEAFYRYAKGAERIINFMNIEKDHTNTILIKYEDIYKNFRPTIHRLCKFLHLDIDGFDMNEIENIPVVGSSTLRSSKEISWTPMEDKSNFNPLNRSSHWKPELHEKFESICSEWHKKLGY